MMNNDELEKLLDSSDSVLSLLNMRTEDLAAKLGQEFAAMKGFQQNNPHHCYDLLEHTIHCVVSIPAEGLEKSELFLLRLAALFHDIGKLKTAKDKGNRTVFYGHAEKSREMAASILPCLGIDGDTCERICWLIGNHDVFINFKEPEELSGSTNSYLHPITRNEVDRVISKNQRKAEKEGTYKPTLEDYVLLCRLIYADAESQAEEVYMDGDLIDSRKEKERRISLIQQYVYEIAQRNQLSIGNSQGGYGISQG